MTVACWSADIHHCCAPNQQKTQPGERCVSLHSPASLLWGLLSRKKKSAEELQEWKMLVCQFVTKAVCSCVIDWQTVLAQYPWGHTGYSYRVTFFFLLGEASLIFWGRDRERQREATGFASWMLTGKFLLVCLCLRRFMVHVEQKVHNQLLWHGG